MQKRILFQGDSITDCGRNREDLTSTGTGYAHMVTGQLGCEAPGAYTFVNKGISGNRIVDVYARIKADIINLKPDVMSILIGVNDIWGGVTDNIGNSPEKFERVYRWIVREIREKLPEPKMV